MMANLVSGNATVDVEPKTRKVVVRASSRPPPNATEEIAEMVGMGRRERRVNVSRRVVRNCFVLFRVLAILPFFLVDGRLEEVTHSSPLIVNLSFKSAPAQNA